jgi:hypothetical protein
MTPFKRLPTLCKGIALGAGNTVPLKFLSSDLGHGSYARDVPRTVTPEQTDTEGSEADAGFKITILHSDKQILTAESCRQGVNTARLYLSGASSHLPQTQRFLNCVNRPIESGE